MKLLTFPRLLIRTLFLLLFPLAACTQNGTSTKVTFKVGDQVEAKHTTAWYPAKVVQVLRNGQQYKVELYPTNGGKAFTTLLDKSRIRAAAKKQEANTNSTTNIGNVKVGKYTCTASKYVNGSYEFIGRGSFTITKDGKYTYNGFEKPSTGTYKVDKDGNLLFSGGYFDGGKAEKIDRPDKYFLVFPSNPDNRWTCTLVTD